MTVLALAKSFEDDDDISDPHSHHVKYLHQFQGRPETVNSKPNHNSNALISWRLIRSLRMGDNVGRSRNYLGLLLTRRCNHGCPTGHGTIL